MSKHYVTVEFYYNTIEVAENGELLPSRLFADVEVTTVYDHNYGADADGHRGVRTWWVDDVNILSIYDEKGVKIPEKSETEEMYDLIDKAISEIDLVKEEDEPDRSEDR